MTHIAIPIDVIISVLETMYYCFSPYLDNMETIQDYEWIVELIEEYNKLLAYLPEEILYENKLTKIEL
ncbi:MAG TPA: hypothetical protein PLS84_04265 [Salinivirgaceae bacterium]|jgi:hypothetical protein|nr:hypothetical protein [Salinivirgaceae bacterium]